MTPQELAAAARSGVWRQPERPGVITEYIVPHPYVACRVTPAPRQFPCGSVLLSCEAVTPDRSCRRTTRSGIYPSIHTAVGAAMHWLETRAVPLMLTSLPNVVRFRAGRGWRIGTVQPSSHPERVTLRANDTGAMIIVPLGDVRPHYEHSFAYRHAQ